MNNKNRQKAISTGLPIAMFTLWMAFAPTRQPFRIGLLFAHKNGHFGCSLDDIKTSQSYLQLA